MQNIDEAEEIGIYIPKMPGSKEHHVISKGQRPRFYRPEDLGDTGQGKTLWVDAFEKILVGLHWTLGMPVPYAFRTPDGTIRSLDAGCIKMLLNRTPPELILNCDADGFIQSVAPTSELLNRYQPIKVSLIKRIVDASPEGTL
ncbi:hypothetical protein [Bradyrhizobium japonicum]|uniref:hypothetical protein n=1 Tax=Bradyrhizobium japonicum TaxID=375 RepID=UPI001BA45611|nr:hypothetical protein [Bradyrhizobium japonicum]MBR0761562.1 hypothetical protein [Bradyrhizobium japonicum]